MLRKAVSVLVNVIREVVMKMKHMVWVLSSMVGVGCAWVGAVFFLGGCGGGGGVQYPPQLAVNDLNLVKTEWQPEFQDFVTSEFVFPDYKERLRISEREGPVPPGKESYRYQEFKMDEKVYQFSGKNDGIVISTGGRKVKKIWLPRYVNWMKILGSIQWNSSEYIVLYLQLQKTSNTSALIVLDKQMVVRYQEYLPCALSVGVGEHPQFGSFLFIETNPYYFSWGENGERIKNPINGKWLYYVP